MLLLIAAAIYQSDWKYLNILTISTATVSSVYWLTSALDPPLMNITIKTLAPSVQNQVNDTF